MLQRVVAMATPVVVDLAVLFGHGGVQGHDRSLVGGGLRDDRVNPTVVEVVEGKQGPGHHATLE